MIKNIKLYLLVLLAIVVCVALYARYFWQPPVHKVAVEFHHMTPIAGPWQQHAPPRDPWDGLHFPMTVTEALTHGDSEFALRPDRRFLSAISLLEAFPAKAAGNMPEAVFTQGRWAISFDHTDLGNLPAYPDFTDAMQLLRTEARRRLGSQTGVCNTQASGKSADAISFDDGSLTKELTELDRQYKSGTPSDPNVLLAAESLSRLAFLDADSVSIDDPLASRAMVVVALAETECGRSMPKEESLLAAHLGYWHAAAKAVGQLPADDPWRLYLNRQYKQLEQYAQAHPHDQEASYFWLLNLADHDRKTDWKSWYDKRYGDQFLSVPVLATILRFSGFDSIESFIGQLPKTLLPEMQGTFSPSLDQEDVEAAPAQLIRDFESAAQHLKLQPQGPYLTRAGLLSYYRGFLLTGLYTEGHYQLRLQDSLQAAKAYRDALEGAPGDLGKDLYRWVNAEVQFKQLGIPLDQLVKNMAESVVLSPHVYDDAWKAACARLDWGTLQDLAALKRLSQLYDTRPDIRAEYAKALMGNMRLPMYAAAQASLAEQENPNAPDFRVWEDYFNGDKDDLLRIASDPHIERGTRVYAVPYATLAGASNREVRSAYEDLIKTSSDSVDVCERYLQHLSDTKDYAALEREARFCLTHVPADYSGLATDDYIVDIADAQLFLGEKAKAWETISKALYGDSDNQSAGGPRRREIVNYYANILGEASYIALAQGNDELAESLAKALSERYPDAIPAQMGILRVWWTEKQYEKAANFLIDWKYPLMYWNWTSNIGKTFAEVFKHNPAGARAAFKALQHPRDRTNGIGDGPLVFIAGAVADSGDPSLAFELRQYRALPITPDNFPGELDDYQVLKQAKGSAAAIPWLIKHSTPPGPQDAARREWLFYTDNQSELLWSSLADPKNSTDPEQVWLYRAAAYLQGLPTSKDEIAQLQAHFKQTNANWQDLLGRYLMGQADTQTIMTHPFTDSQLFEAIYFVAIRQLADGNYTEGQQLLELEMDTAKSQDWNILASSLLNYWRSSQSLPVLSKQGKLYQSGT